MNILLIVYSAMKESLHVCDVRNRRGSALDIEMHSSSHCEMKAKLRRKSTIGNSAKLNNRYLPISSIKQKFTMNHSLIRLCSILHRSPVLISLTRGAARRRQIHHKSLSGVIKRIMPASFSLTATTLPLEGI